MKYVLLALFVTFPRWLFGAWRCFFWHSWSDWSRSTNPYFYCYECGNCGRKW
jgi:hypothetical protein